MLPTANHYSLPVASHTCTVETLLKKILNHEDTKSQRNTKKKLSATLCLSAFVVLKKS